LRSKHNDLEEVTERASEELAQAKLIRCSADQDLMQALKSVKDLTAELGAPRRRTVTCGMPCIMLPTSSRFKKMLGSPRRNSFQSYLNNSMLM
jgi:hypothetical protein